MPTNNDDDLLSEDARWNRVLDVLSDYSDQWREFRRQVNAAIGILSSEMVRLQKYIEHYEAGDTERWAANDKDRMQRQRKTDLKLWGIIVTVAVMVVVNLLVLVYFIGRANGG